MYIHRHREIFKKKSLTLLYIFIDKYKEVNIPEIASFINGLLKDLEAIENAVSSVSVKVLVSFINSKIVIKYPYKDFNFSL